MSNANDKSAQPFWKMLLLYPTLLVAIITAAPNWIDAFKGWQNGISAEAYPRREKQQEFLVAAVRDNLPCLSAPQMYHVNPDGLQIDATICKSGDIVFRTVDPSRAKEDRVAMNIIFVEDVLGNRTWDRTAFLGVGAAYASEIQEFPAPRLRQSNATQLAADLEIVVCQEVQSDDRTVKRHVKRGAQCFDEFWDTLTGKISDRTAVACRSSC